MTRIDQKFAQLKDEGRRAFVAYIMAGDPDYATSLKIVKGLPAVLSESGRAGDCVDARCVGGL